MENENTLAGKVAAITGGTRGIGYSIAEELLREGASVFICGRDEKSLQDALRSLALVKNGQSAARMDGMTADVGRYQDCRRFITGAAERFGGLDILVNNAGVGIMKPVAELSPEDWDQTLHTNLSSVFYCSHEAIPLLRRRGGGYIFNISSLAGANAFPGGAAYNASKFGLNGFSEAMMQEVRYDGIRVSYIMPGSVDTGFGAHGGSAGPGGKPHASWKLAGEDVAKAVVDLYRFPSRALASRIEMRPSQPPRK
ncbi:MAG TPA: SDR family oxidoreductase [Terriglobia bacterium]|nr:SDR family oxidoreductase [Terriglobia bacterium]